MKTYSFIFCPLEIFKIYLILLMQLIFLYTTFSRHYFLNSEGAGISQIFFSSASLDFRYQRNVNKLRKVEEIFSLIFLLYALHRIYAIRTQKLGTYEKVIQRYREKNWVKIAISLFSLKLSDKIPLSQYNYWFHIT